jgi:hypothetical protein
MNWLAKTVRALSPNCQEAIRLQSEALDRPLSWMQRIGLRFHLALCVWCSRYGKQIKFLRTAAQRCDHDHDPKQTMPPEARERIKRRLQNEKNQT